MIEEYWLETKLREGFCCTFASSVPHDRRSVYPWQDLSVVEI